MTGNDSRADSRLTHHDSRSSTKLPAAVRGSVWMGGAVLSFSILLGAAVIFAGTYYSIRRESR